MAAAVTCVARHYYGDAHERCVRRDEFAEAAGLRTWALAWASVLEWAIGQGYAVPDARGVHIPVNDRCVAAACAVALVTEWRLAGCPGRRLWEAATVDPALRGPP